MIFAFLFRKSYELGIIVVMFTANLNPSIRLLPKVNLKLNF